MYILDNFTVSASEIKQLSIYEETLEEISRKQITSEVLVNIHDKVFEFFEILEQQTRFYLSYKT